MEPTERVRGNGKALRTDRKGGIEGLPLQLMVIVLIAALGTGVMVGWMNSIETPRYIGGVETDSAVINICEDIGVTVRVTDHNGDPLEGAVVSLTGCGIRTAEGGPVNGITGGDGTVAFEGLSIIKDQRVRYIGVEAVKPDYGSKRTQIVVIP